MISQVDEIKNKLDIVEVISSYMQLQKAGINYKAPCPFHGEKTPSFFVSPERQIWHCFGCGKGGDMFKFIMEMENTEFKDALRVLAQKAGVVLKYEDRHQDGEKRRLYEVMSYSVKFFKDSIENTSQGKEALNYLLGRGLQKATIDDFMIGWAPESWTSLVNVLKKNSFSDKEIISAGVAVEGKKTDMRTGSKCYDRFRSRIMFPLFDHNGQVVGFTGRVFQAGPPQQQIEGQIESKYVNTPQTQIYDKSRILYGLDRAKADIRKEGFVLLVEGQMDLIMSHQAGIKNSVAVSGTALTGQHLKTLRNYSDLLYTCFDMDAAGDSATKRGIDIAMQEGFDVRVVVLPQGKDPADFIKESPDQWPTLISQNKRIMDFYFESAFSRNDPKTLDGRKKIAGDLLFQIKKLQNEIEKSHWIGELASRLQIKEHYLIDELKKIKVDFENLVRRDLPEKAFEKKSSSMDREIFERFLGVSFRHPEIYSEIKDLIKEIEEEIFEDDLVLTEILYHLKERKSLALDEFKKDAPGHVHAFIENALFKFECTEKDFEKKDAILQELKFYIKKLRFGYIKEELDKIKMEMQKAEKNGNKKDLEALFAKFSKKTEDFSKVMKM